MIVKDLSFHVPPLIIYGGGWVVVGGERKCMGKLILLLIKGIHLLEGGDP